MPSLKRGIQGVKTMGGLVDRRRARTSAGALMEMSVMANEKKRLEQELGRLGRRQAEINARLADIADKERRLYEFVKKPCQDARVAPAADTGQRLRMTELSY